jgi:hypothetical protein
MNCGNIMAGIAEQCHQSRNRHLEFIERMKTSVKGTSIAKIIRLLDKQHDIESVDLLGPDQYFEDENGNFFKYRITFKDRVNPIEDYSFASIYYQDHFFFFNLPEGVEIF